MNRQVMGLLAGLAMAPAAAGAAVLEVAGFGEETELSVFDAAVDAASGLRLSGDETLSLALGYEGGDPAGAEGGFELLGGDGVILDGALATLASADGTLELVFDDLTGSAAVGSGALATVTLDFGGAFGADPLAAFEDGGAYEAGLAFALGEGSGAGPAPIPLPAAGLLMLAALGGLGVAGRHRASGRA